MIPTVEILQDYLSSLYEIYDQFQANYQSCHKRSYNHNEESCEEYYLRWSDKMRTEIRRIEKEVAYKVRHKICIPNDITNKLQSA